MSKKLQLKIITPEKIILDEMVDSVTIPTTEGEIGVFPEHIPLIAKLSKGDIVATNNDEHIPYVVVGGFVEVRKEEDNSTVIVILADFAEHVSTLTDEAIAKAKTKAEELKIQAEKKEVVDFEHFETELERSLTKVKIADKWRNRKYRI